jgi:putative heme-binding domain-containing protein
MSKRNTSSIVTAALLLVAAVCLLPTDAAGQSLELKPGDHICYIGNTTADRMQHHGWLETYIYARHPKHDIVFRNLGFPGDELKTRSRSANFGSPDQWLSKCKADVIFCFFGSNEARRGEGGLSGFEKDLNDVIGGMQGQQYNGKSAPRLVLFSPIAHEDLKSPHLPDGSDNNKSLAAYTAVMKKVCAAKEIPFVDLFAATQKLYASAKNPLTMNGIHLLDHGNEAVAEAIMSDLFGSRRSTGTANIQKIRDAVLDKNYHWFSRYRVVDGYNVYGGRSKLAWHGQSNAAVMRREMEIFDVMTSNRDQRIWAIAAGGDMKVKDDNLPKQLVVQTNKKGPLEGGKFPYLGGVEAINKMKIAEGMEVNLFASEEMFPRLINPVQMAVDTDSRLWCSVWPSYPHWNPTEPRKDALVILPDEDDNGVADECIVFADELNSITGFEFWGGGVLVFAPPEIWFLKDTDGDDKADYKVRMLQGVSSADTHHSANAVVVGPDGWLYWSRGIFNVANFETPTKLYRSGASGAHRFNPRTFEVEFHFPIGPNPHGDVIDQWGYQFVNDGTGGTGSYVNIGKGIGNKKWFQKRVRPVPATGILSSGHFPQRNSGNFLICNSIGFLGVLQHEVKYNGADITATEIEPILVSSDPNFRPTDVEIGGDGALYVSDWCNTLIGHMQHNMRDPNRDHTHGRVYRVTAKGRPLLEPAKMKNKPVADVCENFFANTNSIRYRARLELSGHETKDVLAKVSAWASKLSPDNVSKDRDEAQALLECLWVFEEHRVPNIQLVQKVLKAAEPRVRAAAIRTLGHWAGRVEGWESVLVAAGQDSSALVRAEAVKAAVEFQGLAAAEVIFEVGTRPTDPELNTVLNYARGRINVDQIVKDALAGGGKLSVAAQKYVLRNASVDDLLKMDRTEAVYEAILARPKVPAAALKESLSGLAKLRKENELDLLLAMIVDRDANNQSDSLGTLGGLLASQPAASLEGSSDRLAKLAAGAKSSAARQAGYAAWITAEGSADDAFLAASTSKEKLGELLGAVALVSDKEIRAGMYTRVRPLIFELPANLSAEQGSSAIGESGIKVDYFEPHSNDAAIETLAKRKPTASGIVPDIKMNVPQKKRADAFALRFTGMITLSKSGKYTFFTNSDDGSRLYIGKQLVVNNDGSHGPQERSGSIDLSAGSHPITVTYFDSGGGDALHVAYAGPGIKKQAIPGSALSVSGGETLHDIAIRTLKTIPGHEAEKFNDLARLIKAGRSRTSAIRAISAIPQNHWAKNQLEPLADNLVAYLSEIPAKYRTGPAATSATNLAKTLAGKLPPQQTSAIQSRLANLDVRVIAIGTVPARMIYDKEVIAVQAGKPVEFRFSNSDHMPHNFAIVQPGHLATVGELAEATARDADAMARNYIPKSDKIMLASKLLQPGESQALAFKVPTEPGIYPYVCTYPGHWRRMFGALYVVDNLEDYQANPTEYLAKAKLPVKDDLLNSIGQETEWKLADLTPDLEHFMHGRSYAVGKQLFTAANCLACHKMNGVGFEIGPDLTKIDPKNKPLDILRSLLEPSQKIDEKYQSYLFELKNGKIITGMIVAETPQTVSVIENPLAKSKPVVIKKADIDAKEKSAKSIMPEGQLSKLRREEVLDLLGYIYARGDEKHKLFKEHDH